MAEQLFSGVHVCETKQVRLFVVKWQSLYLTDDTHLRLMNIFG